MIIRRRVRVTGQVQGVGYRFTCEREARSWRVAGWVTNCDDGSVEAVFQGDGAVVAEMIARCRSGPPAARVDRIEESPELEPVPAGFVQKPTC